MLKKIVFIILILSFFNEKTYSITNQEAYDFFRNYINENNMKNIISYIYKTQPSFFLEDPISFFPLDNNNIEDFFYSIEPLNNFLDPLLWGNIIFPFSIASLSNDFDDLLKKSNDTDIEKILSSDVIFIKGGTYPAIKKQLLFVKEIIKEFQNNKPLFLIADETRLNTNLYYESFNYIVSDIESTINKKLTEDDLIFIESNLKNEYGIALIINHFFNIDNMKILKFNYDEFIFQLNIFLTSKGYKKAHVLFVSNNIFTLYNQLQYEINILDMPDMTDSNYSVTFCGQDIPLKDPKNPEGIFLRKLKMMTILLSLIINNIDN